MTRDSRPIVGWRKVKSFYVDHTVTHDEDIARLHALLLEFIQSSRTYIYVEQYGGAINDLDPVDTAFVHRNRVLYDVQLVAHSNDEHEDRQALETIRRFFEVTKSQDLFAHTQSYQNYLDEDLPDYLRRYYGSNLERLVAVKRRVDPHNVFRSPQSIPVKL